MCIMQSKPGRTAVRYITALVLTLALSAFAALSGAQADDFPSHPIRTKLRAQAFEPIGGTPAEFADLIARDSAKWAAVAKAAGLTN